MTGAGAPGAAGIIRCLLQDSRLQLTVADADHDATGRYLHGAFVPIPRADDADFTRRVLQVCRERGVQVVMPLVTRELEPFAAAKAEFEAAGIRLLVSGLESLRAANNKAACYQRLQAAGIRVPDFRVAATVGAFEDACRQLGYPGKPVCFKPSVSNGSRGFRIVSGLADEHDLLFNQKPGSGYMSYGDAVRILSAKPFPELLVSEYLPGDEYSVDCLARDGEAVLVVPRLRQKMLGGISVRGRFERDEAIMGYCKSIIEELKLHGNIGIQVKRHESGVPLLLEVNPRVQGTIVAGLGAGVNLPLLAVKQALGLPIDPLEMQVKWGRGFSRYWSEVFYGGAAET